MGHIHSMLSQGAQIHYPGSDVFAEATARWSVSVNSPSIAIVVVPDVENDVAVTVRTLKDVSVFLLKNV